MQTRGVMFLDDETVALPRELSAARFLRLGEIAFPVVGLDIERRAPGHGYTQSSPGARRRASARISTGSMSAPKDIALRPFTCGCFLRFLLRGSLLCRSPGFGFRLAPFLVAEALLERSHQVDDVRAFGRRRVRVRILDDLLALRLLLFLDQPVKCIDIAIMELVWVEL